MSTENVNKKIKKVPKLRFSNFKIDWEEKKAGEIFENLSDKNHSGDLPLLAVTQNDGVVYRSDLDLRINSSEDGIKSYKIINPGNFVISLRSFQGGIEYSKIKGISSSAYTVLKSKIKIDDNFYKILFKKQSFINELNNLIYGIRDGKQISYSEFKFLKLPYPEFEEQQKIANFLVLVDVWIENLKEQKENFNLYKKGVMQKIFSQEIFFRDENGNEFQEWETKYLDDVAIFLKGKGISKDDITENGINKCIRYGELYTTYNEVISSVKSRTNITKSDSFLSKKNDILIPSSGETALDIATVSCINEDGVLLGGDLNIIRLKENNDGIFFAHYLSNFKDREIAELAQGNTVVHLYSSSLKKLKINTPSFLEQQKIAKFLTSINKTIEAKEEQISKVEEWKKGLMQRLFV